MPVDSMMPSFKSVFYLAGFLLQAYVFAAPQDAVASAMPAALPSLGGPQNENSDCNACTVVADIVAVVWYSEIFVNEAATRIVNVAVGNATRTTRTTLVTSEALFTIEPGALGDELTARYQYESFFVTGNATLFSPTPYNVFKAYTVTSQFSSGGSCQTVTNPPVTLSVAFTETIPEASGAVYLNTEGQQRFLEYVSVASCSTGSEQVSILPLAQVTNSTVLVTSTTGGALATTNRTLARTGTVSTTTVGVTTLTRIVRTVSITGAPGLTPTAVPVTIPISRTSPSPRAPLIVIGSTTTITPAPISLPILSQRVTTKPGAGAGSVPVPVVVPGGSVVTVPVVVPSGAGITVPVVLPSGKGSVTIPVVVPGGSVTVPVVVPSGRPGGKNFTTVAIVPYLSRGTTWRKAGSSWVELSMAGAVGLFCAVLLYL